MKLNEKERAEFINILKKEYNRNKELFDNNQLYWLKDDKERENYIKYLDDIKEKFETLEKQEEVEIEVPLFDFGNDASGAVWWGILGLIATATLFNSGNGSSIGEQLSNCYCELDTKDNKDLN